MKLSLTFFLAVFFTVGSFAQTEYFTTDGKNRFTQPELEEMLKELKEKYSKAFSKEVFVDFEVKEAYRSGDSIINTIGFEIADKKTVRLREKNKLYSLKGEEFPEFELSSLSGGTFDLEKLKGKPTMINFWFTRCAPCIDEMPTLNSIAEEFGDKVNFVAITYESNDAVKEFLTRHDFDFIHLVDARSFTKDLRIGTYPTNVFLDSEGVIVKVEGGIAYEKNENGEVKMGEGEEIIRILESLEE
ncbi:TlpA family protein disulfide reductase [Robertkochia aurantiaca]|uniref:TlpA family protein disulfide reductase n=1 Tax=Robertkochia aurantiaca TaxID=2873700 RepID=UPI001CCFE62B|nr:TlpA disulfide reductase family protein [Robertkochia sp. 3YJGBD-33]